MIKVNFMLMNIQQMLVALTYPLYTQTTICPISR